VAAVDYDLYEFATWLLSPEAVIGGYGAEEFGQPPSLAQAYKATVAP
jgi:hypothetical protein